MNGSQVRSEVTDLCTPVILTTARTGPDCSTTTASTRLAKSSSRTIRSAAYRERSSSIAISWPSCATWRPPTYSPAIRLVPRLGMTARTAPVSISTVPSVCETVNGAVTGAPAPTVSWSGPPIPAVAAIAWPDHLIEPSGQ